jgi:hypothetical protein
MVLYGIIPLAWSFGPKVWLLYVVLPACEAIGMVNLTSLSRTDKDMKRILNLATILHGKRYT